MASDATAGPDVKAAATAVDVGVVLRLLARQRWVILSVFCAVVAVTVFITLSLPRYYESVVTLEYDPAPARPLGSQVEDVAIPGGDLLASKEWYHTQNAIIASRAVALKVVERLALHRDPDFMGVPKNERDRWTGADKEQAAKQVQDLLKVKQERDTRVARIEVRDRNAERAALIANTLADAYMTWIMDERLGSTVRAVEWLSGQLDDVSRRLDSSEHALYDFRRKNDVPSTSLADQQHGITQTINGFGVALTDATTQRIRVEAKLRQLEGALAQEPIQVRPSLTAESSALSELRKQWYNALASRDALALRYGSSHPEMQRHQSQMDAITAAMRAEIQGLVESVRAELRQAQDVEAALREAKQRAQRLGLDLSLHEIDYNRLERERVNNEKLHTLLLQRTAETNLTRLLKVSPVRLVDRAVAAPTPVTPRPLLNLGAGCLVGLAAGLGLAILRTRVDRRVTMTDDVVAAGATLLGVIPSIVNDKGISYGARYGRRRKRRREEQAFGESKDLVVHLHPRSSVAEQCRTLRTNLAFMSPDKPLRTLVVTSPGPSEGKSTLANSLAITFAQSGRRTLLADTDLRRPRLHRVFGVQGTMAGITSVLAGELDLMDCIRETPVEGLSLLPCGPIPPNPAELLHSAVFARLLEELRTRFDVVVMDSPPVGVVIDAAIVGPQVDGAIMVAKSGRTTRDALKHGLRQMQDVGSNVLGCVLNDIDLSRLSEYSGYYYYRGYTYEADSTGRGGGGGPSGPVTGAPNVAE